MSSEIAVSAHDVFKSFKLPHEKHSGIKQAVINFRPGKKYEVQHVLENISFEIKKGEFFGIVGRNGSGKSTLLKLLAQIYTPDSGAIAVNGTLTPFIELGVGFNPELTGRENVYLNGALLGFDRKQIKAMYEDIVEFAEIEKFMDQKLKNYSSGMQVRLAFSIAIRAESDILLVDEVLAVGDAAFQQKCFDYFDDLKKEKRTIVFVSHDMASVVKFCDRALFMKSGRIETLGTPTEVAFAYDRDNYHSNAPTKTDTQKFIANVSLRNNQGLKSNTFSYLEDINIELDWEQNIKAENVGLTIFSGQACLFATNTFNQLSVLGNNKAVLQLKSTLGPGRYRVAYGVFGTRLQNLIEYRGDAMDFHVLRPKSPKKPNIEWVGTTYIEHKWIVPTQPKMKITKG